MKQKETFYPTKDQFIKVNIKVDEPLMSAYDFVTSINHVDKTILEIMDLYIQYHLQRQAEFIAEIAEIHYPASNNLNPTVNRESILSASKEYVELNIKR